MSILSYPALAQNADSPPAATDNSSAKTDQDKMLDKVRQAIVDKFPQIDVISVAALPYGNLYEVSHNEGIFYVDKDLTFLFNGELADLKTGVNVTEQRMAELEKDLIKTLPLENAIKVVHGDGKRVLITFEDPNCGYCKRLVKALTKVENVTIYTFIVPMLSPDSVTKGQKIWCALDRNVAWVNYMATNGELMNKTDCENPLIPNRVLAQKLRISGVPAIFFPDGTRVSGFIDTEEIERRLKLTSNE